MYSDVSKIGAFSLVVELAREGFYQRSYPVYFDLYEDNFHF